MDKNGIEIQGDQWDGVVHNFHGKAHYLNKNNIRTTRNSAIKMKLFRTVNLIG